MRRNTEVEKEFSPSHVGDRVGWVRAKAIDDSPFVAIDVVTTKIVSEEGAELSNQTWQDDEGESTGGAIPYQKGFGETAAFSAFVSNERNWQEESNLQYIPEGMSSTYSYHKPTASELLASGTGDNRSHADDAEKLWAESPKELLETLQELLGTLNIEGAYATMYYWMNGAVGREYPARSELTYVNPADLILADPAMQSQTKEQLEHIKQIQTALSQNLTNDVNMRHRLTGFIGDTPMESLPSVFEDSRQRAATSEELVRAAVQGLAVKRLAYVPTGHGRAGRTWPYMDATEADPDKAYGLELKDLRARKIDRAVREIDREIKELEARRTLATESIQRFTLLNELERSLL